MVDLRSLRHAVVLARHLNFTRAAEELRLSQSGLTRSLQALEQQIGMRLFDRDRGSVALSLQGRHYIDKAQHLLESFDDFERSTLGMATGHSGRVSFGMAPLPARVLLPQALTSRFRTSPELAFDVPVRNTDALWLMLDAGDIEFFVAGEGQQPDMLALRVEALGHFPVSLIVRAGHPLLRDRNAQGRFPVLMSSRHGGLSPMVQRFITGNEGVAHVIEDFDTLSALTRSTDAIWITTDHALASLADANAFCRLELGLGEKRGRYRVLAYSLARRSQSVAAQALLRDFRRIIRRLNSSHSPNQQTSD
jgi:DNA-binding transcriptional LysR family regulator